MGTRNFRKLPIKRAPRSRAFASACVALNMSWWGVPSDACRVGVVVLLMVVVVVAVGVVVVVAAVAAVVSSCSCCK